MMMMMMNVIVTATSGLDKLGLLITIIYCETLKEVTNRIALFIKKLLSM